MAEPELARVYNTLNDLQTRLKIVADMETPYQKRLVEQLDAVTHAVDKITIEGTPMMQERMGEVSRTVAEMRIDLKETRAELRASIVELRKYVEEEFAAQEREKRTDRRVLLGAAATFIFGLGLQLVMFLVNRVAGG